MTRWLVGTIACLALGASSLPASAGVYTDDMAKCLVKSASVDDQLAMIKWMFAAFSLHPAVQSLASISDQDRDALNKAAGGLFERLLTHDCRAETVAALKYEGVGAIEASFQVFGQVAGRGLANDPHVAVGIQQLGTYIDKAKLEQLSKDAGLAK